MEAYRTDGRDSERRGSDSQFGRNFEQPVFLQTLEELELEYQREAMELGRVRDKEEDEENNNHREAVKEMRDNYAKKLATIRGTHGKQREESLQLDLQRRQHQTRSRQELSGAAGFGGYKQPLAYPPEYDIPAAVNHAHYGGANMLPMDSRRKLPNSVDNNYGSSSYHDNFGDFPRQRREEYRKTYNRY